MSDPSAIDDLLHHCRSLGLAADPGTLFRRPALRSRGKAFAFLGRGDTVMVKLPQDRIAELAATGTAAAVTMGTRTMREWAAVQPSATPEERESLAVEAYRFVT